MTNSRHEARHPLPISNGYGYSTGEGASVYCGRCDDTFAPDAEWVGRYFTARRDRLARDRHLGPGARTDAAAELDRSEGAMLAEQGINH